MKLYFWRTLTLEKEMAAHSSVLAWRIPRMGEPGGLPSMGSHRVGHDWSELAAAAAFVRGSVYFQKSSFWNCIFINFVFRFRLIYWVRMGFPCVTSVKETGCQYRKYKRRGFDPWVRKISWRRAWQPQVFSPKITKVFLPEEYHRQRSLIGYSP